MRFEDAIKAMREGKRARMNGSGFMYYIEGGELMYDGLQSSNRISQMLDKEWSIVEPPLPLPRRFRAKDKSTGKPCTGATWPSGVWYWNNNKADCHRVSGLVYGCDPSLHLESIEYIDPPCTD